MPDTSVVTSIRREALCKITSGAVSSIPAVTHIALGDGGADDSGEPLIPSEAQTQLNNEIARYEISTVSYPLKTTARYTVTIPKDTLSGAKISEAALVDSEGNLAAIKNMYVKQKDADLSFVFTFEDEF